MTTLIGAQQLRREIPWARPLFEAYIAGAWFLYWTDDTLYWVAKPIVHTEIVNEQRRLHCGDGPTLESDVENLYFWHGVLVPAFVVTRPDWITVEHIMTEENAEVRRVMLERMGHERFLGNLGAEPAHQDECGELFRVKLDGDEDVVLVRVVNSTPEEDGSSKQYVLRVPPGITTAREAVAWTFDLTRDTYQPEIQT